LRGGIEHERVRETEEVIQLVVFEGHAIDVDFAVKKIRARGAPHAGRWRWCRAGIWQ